MRTTLCGICLVGLLSAVLIAALPARAAEQGGRENEMHPVVYPVADLSVWSPGGDQFEPTFLISHIKAKIAPDSWERGSISKHETTPSLVIRQTQANHQKIADLLTEIRRAAPHNLGLDIEDRMVPIVYPVADLPVWTYETTKPESGARPDFGPTLLISQIKTTVDPDSWEDRGHVSPHETTAALVVRQTRANHQKVADLLKRLRRHHPDEEIELINATDE